jgi:hypothetical protein
LDYSDAAECFSLLRLTESRSERQKTNAPAEPLKRPDERESGGWEFAMLSFPCRHLAHALAGAAGFPTLFSTASGVIGLVAGPSSAFRH